MLDHFLAEFEEGCTISDLGSNAHSATQSFDDYFQQDAHSRSWKRNKSSELAAGTMLSAQCAGRLTGNGSHISI